MTNLLQIIFNPKYILASITISIILYSFFKSQLTITSQTIMKQDINLKLLISLMCVMFLFVGFSLYYTITLDNLSSEQITIKKEANLYKQHFADILMLKTRLEESKAYLEQQYQTLREDNNKIASSVRDGCTNQNI